MTALERDNRSFCPRIESWRGIAALMVAWFHAWGATWRESSGELHGLIVPAPQLDGAFFGLITRLVRFTMNGGGAVSAFFVMSGFVLALSLDRGPQEFESAAWRFFPARVFRLYPAVIASTAVFAVVFWTTGASLTPADYSPEGLVRNALLLDTSINGVTWSLQVEVIATFVIFLAFAMQRRWNTGSVVILALALAALSFAGMRRFGLDLTMLCAFVFGMVAFYYHNRIRTLSSSAAIALFIVAFAAMCACRPVLSYTSQWAALLEAALAAVVVVFLAYGKLGLAALPFDLKIIRFYGRISYSFYLLHPLILIAAYSIPGALGAVVAVGVPSAVVGLALAVATIAATTPLAWLSYRYVEKPGVAFGKMVCKRATRPTRWRPNLSEFR